MALPSARRTSASHPPLRSLPHRAPPRPTPPLRAASSHRSGHFAVAAVAAATFTALATSHLAGCTARETPPHAPSAAPEGIATSPTTASLPTGSPAPPAATASPTAAFSVDARYDGHILSVPVRLGDRVDTRFIFDTGIGIDLVTTALCKRLGCNPAGTYTGKRMSGQAITVPLATVPSIALGGLRRENVVVGVADGLADQADVEGFLSLGFFGDRAVTIDDGAGKLHVEDTGSLGRRAAGGAVIPVDVERDGPSVTMFVKMRVGKAEPRVEIDTGSHNLILHRRYVEQLGVDLKAPGTEVKRGKDETGHAFERVFTFVDQPIAFAAAPALSQQGARVLFQDIIHDGLVGHALLTRYDVTFDVAGSRIVLAPRPSTAATR